MKEYMNSLKIYLIAIFCLLFHLFSFSQSTYYYKLMKKIENGIEKTNTAGGQFITFKDNICYDSDKYGESVGNGQLKFESEYSNSSKTYVGNSYFGNVVYRFKQDLSVLNIVVTKNLVYVYKRTTPPSSQLTCSLIKKKNTSGSNYNYNYGYNYGYNNNYNYNNSYNSSTNSNSGSSNSSVNQNSSRYTDKTCHSCHGSGICNTCNGKGWYERLGVKGTMNCPNCSNGKCSICGGTGKVRGLR